MKNLIVTLVMVCLAVPGTVFSGQGRPVPDGILPGNRFPGRIDSLSGAGDAARFLSGLDKAYSGFIPNEGMSFNDKEIQRVVKSLKAKAFVKADLNGDGLTDMLLAGSMNNSPAVIAVIDSGGGRFSAHQLAGSSGEAVVAAVPGKYRKVPFVTAVVRETKMKNGRTVTAVIRMKLAFRCGAFIEFNPSPENHRISKIEFSSLGCFGRCPVFSLSVDSSGEAVYTASKHNPKQGVFSVPVGAGAFAELSSLLNYAGFTTLDSSYRVQYTDAPRSLISISYGGGRIKRISDYGMRGTLGLMRVYDLFFRLRENLK